MLDLDGTIYQTLDMKESAWHATISNGRSIGIEIANVGAYPVGGKNPFGTWYEMGADGKTALKIPGGLAKSGIRNQSIPLRPDRPGSRRPSARSSPRLIVIIQRIAPENC
jgi:hypothetical protein